MSNRTEGRDCGHHAKSLGHDFNDTGSRIRGKNGIETIRCQNTDPASGKPCGRSWLAHQKAPRWCKFPIGRNKAGRRRLQEHADTPLEAQSPGER